MRFFTYALCVLGCLLASAIADAQFLRSLRPAAKSRPSCANGSCEVPTFNQSPPAKPSEPNIIGKDQGGVKEERGADVPAPVEPPARRDETPIVQPPAVNEGHGDLFGVDWQKIANAKYDSKNAKITLADSIEFVRGSYADEKQMCRLVVIGTPSERGPVLDAFNALPATERSKVSPWFIAADHWSLRDSDGGTVRFETLGKPTVYLLAPDGAVVHRQDGWSSQEDVEAIRKGLKKNDPKRDPDLRKSPDPERLPLVGWRRVVRDVLPAALVCGAAASVLSLFRRRSP